MVSGTGGGGGTQSAGGAQLVCNSDGCDSRRQVHLALGGNQTATRGNLLDGGAGGGGYYGGGGWWMLMVAVAAAVQVMLEEYLMRIRV